MAAESVVESIFLMVILIFLFYFIYLFLQRGSTGERQGEKHQCERETSISCLLHAANWGPGPQPRHVP